jgi:hypothetical protein
MTKKLCLLITKTKKNRQTNLYYFYQDINGELYHTWRKAGVFDVLYKSTGKTAAEVAETVKAGIDDMLANSEEYRKLKPLSGNGDYEEAIDFLQSFYDFCIKLPESIVQVLSLEKILY